MATWETKRLHVFPYTIILVIVIDDSFLIIIVIIIISILEWLVFCRIIFLCFFLPRQRSPWWIIFAGISFLFSLDFLVVLPMVTSNCISCTIYKPMGFNCHWRTYPNVVKSTFFVLSLLVLLSMLRPPQFNIQKPYVSIPASHLNIQSVKQCIIYKVSVVTIMSCYIY